MESAIRLAFVVLRIACVFAILCLAFGVAVSSCGLGSKVVVAEVFIGCFGFDGYVMFPE